MLYQENECLAHLTVHFPNLEISKPVKKHRSAVAIFNPGIVSQISEQRLKNSIDELIWSCKETGYSSGSNYFK